MGSIVNKAAFLPPQPLVDSHDEQEDCIMLQDASGNQFPILHIRARKATKTLLYSHGNAEDITHMHHPLNQLSRTLGVNIIAYEYPGYSFAAFDSNGNYRPPTEAGVYAHAHAAYRWATQQQQIQPQDIIIYGRSLGSGAATELASSVASGGLILQSPIASAIRVVARQPFTLPMDIFANIDKIHRVRSPTLIVHGDQDEVVPFRHGNMLFDRLKATRKRNCWIQGAGHNDIEANYWDQFIGAMKAHIDDISNNTPSTAEIHPEQKSRWFGSSSSSA
eukprot:TRINITY_DN8667_c0_g1_i1.p1 TRINITY_DN8667_c0_g1~~TRINITY_DN8667_c0_g1_i1.p1  ORF type:complete len:277 (-),score=26.87 TRINITY_DN8667_c0_g1_i1:254-1084(-)